jgi:hypothetical protein
MVIKGENTYSGSPGQGCIVPWSGTVGMLPSSGQDGNIQRKSPPGKLMKTVLNGGSMRHDNEKWWKWKVLWKDGEFHRPIIRLISMGPVKS